MADGISTEKNIDLEKIIEDTKSVVIESAIFDSVHIRRTSNKILRSEASNRFEKGLDPNRTYMAIERACTLLEKYAISKVLKFSSSSTISNFNIFSTNSL